jgi:hypothetical protein
MGIHILPPITDREPELTHRDLVISELAASEAALLLEVRELAADLEVHRLMQQVAIAEVARLDRLTRRQSLTIENLRSELRRYTEGQIGRAA